MKRKLLIGTIILFIALLFSGCISSDVPTDTPIILSKDKPSFDVVIKSDNNKVTWTLDDKSRTDELPGDANTAHYLLEFKSLSVGNHVLKVEDSESDLEWQIQVNGTQEEQKENGLQNDDGHFPTWEEQNRIANQKKKNNK